MVFVDRLHPAMLPPFRSVKSRRLFFCHDFLDPVPDSSDALFQRRDLVLSIHIVSPGLQLLLHNVSRSRCCLFTSCFFAGLKASLTASSSIDSLVVASTGPEDLTY